MSMPAERPPQTGNTAGHTRHAQAVHATQEHSS